MRPLKFFNLYIAALLQLWAFEAGAQDRVYSLSIPQAVALGLENNLELKNTLLEVEKSQYGVAEVRRMSLPQIEGYSDFLYSYSIPKMAIPGEILGQQGTVPIEFGTPYDWTIGLRGSQLIFNQSHRTSLEIAEQAVKISELTARQKEEEIADQITKVFALCKVTEYQLEELYKSQKNIDELLAIAEAQLANDIILPADLSRIKVDKNNLLTEIEQVHLVRSQQSRLLKYLMNIPEESEIILNDSIIIDETLALSYVEITQRPEMKLLQQQIAIGELNIKKTKHDYLPTLNLSAQHFYQGMRENIDFFSGNEDTFFSAGILGLHLKIPVFSGFAKRHQLDQHKITLLQLENSKNQTKRYLTQAYETAKQNYINSLKALRRQQENIALAEENYRVNLAGYREQVVGLTDVLLSESNLTEARLGYYNALFEAKKAETEIQKLNGSLLPKK